MSVVSQGIYLITVVLVEATEHLRGEGGMERGGGDARQGMEVLEVKGDVTGVRETDVRSCAL